MGWFNSAVNGLSDAIGNVGGTISSAISDGFDFANNTVNAVTGLAGLGITSATGLAGTALTAPGQNIGAVLNPLASVAGSYLNSRSVNPAMSGSTPLLNPSNTPYVIGGVVAALALVLVVVFKKK